MSSDAVTAREPSALERLTSLSAASDLPSIDALARERSALKDLIAPSAGGYLARAEGALAHERGTLKDLITPSASGLLAQVENTLGRERESLKDLITSKSYLGRAADAFARAPSALESLISPPALERPSITSRLESISRNLSSSDQAWDSVARSAEALRPIEVHVPDIADDLATAFETQAEREQQLHEKQISVLNAIADAGKQQNEAIAGLIALQQLQLNEALENSKLQRLAIYFSALSATLALCALVFR